MDNKYLLKIGLISIAGLVLIYLINVYFNKQKLSQENFNNLNYEIKEKEPDNEIKNQQPSVENNTIEPNDTVQNYGKYNSTNDPNNLNTYPNDCFPKDKLSPQELLPTDNDNKWAQVNPKVQGELGDQNFYKLVIM